ncbi:MAG: hypothetical protein E7292_01085 [Lachnospiraceae bacterium]|nr:hypothetical protein [Lachnospiraceae bacterium]
MFFKKAKRFLAGVCVFSMLFTSINQNALTVMAAEDVAVETVTVAEEPEVLAEETSEPAPDTEDVVKVELPYVEEEEEFIVKGADIEAGGTSDGDDIYEVVSKDSEGNVTGYYGTFNRTQGILTFYAYHTGIGQKAFEYPTGVKEDETWLDEIKVVQFEEGSLIKFIGNRAFMNLPNLQRIDLTNCDMLTGVYEYAFSGCKSVSEVILSDKLQIIEQNAFSGCKALTTITLTPSLITMEGSVFSKCENLSTVIIQANNITCGTSIFNGCSIDDIRFSGSNTVVPGNLFNGATFKETAEIVIPYYVQEIGDSAFQSSKNLTSVTFEDSVSNPSALASVGKNAFNGCSVLKSVTFPNSVKVIEDNAYQGCKALTTLVIPNTVTILGNSAFKDCEGIKELTISNAISTLGTSVFENCKALQSVVVPAGLTLVSDSMFKSCSALTSVTIPTTVKSIGKSAFEKCAALPTIVLPDTVETVGSSAFKGCESLDNPTMPKELTQYSDYLFQDCLDLGIISTSEEPGSYSKGLVIPGAVTSIGTNAFEDCDGIEKLTISRNVETIKGGAFQNDQNIDTLIFETLDLSCGTKIFNGCLLLDVVFPKGITEIPENLFSYGGFNTDRSVTIPATVTKIGNRAFGGGPATGDATTVARILFEDGSQLTTIGDNAFAYCTAVTTFDMPVTVTSIGKAAFEGSINLQAITIPENVTSIGSSAFLNCENLTTVNYDAVNSTAGISTVSSKKVGPFANCNIHTILLGEKVENLPAYLFCGAKFSTNAQRPEVVLITLNIPASVGEIGEYAFSNITNLSKVNFAEASKLRLVGNYAFNECGALTECKLPDTVTTIGNSAFRGCVSLKEMNIPASLITLGSYAFYQCGLIKEYKVPAEVTGIEEYAFYSNTALESIVFEGYEITKIGVSAYEDCENLKAITIPSGTASIGAYAFKNDVALEEVVIPASVTEIGTDAFKGCTNAKFLVIPGSYAETWLKANGFENQIDTTGVSIITYELDGGENDIRNIGGYRAGDVFTFFEPTKPGYSFDGWYLDAAFTNRVYDLTGRTGNFTLYAKWVEGNYTITYVLDGGENHPDNPTNYTYFDAFKFQNPTREGYDFKGWYEDKEWTKGIKEIKEGTWGDKTLYARWEPKQYTVTFDGKNKNAVLSAKTIKVKFNEVYGDLPTATREGYMFDGWYTEDNVLITKDTVVSIAANHTLYAKWVLDVRVENPTSNIQTGRTLEKGTRVMLSTETPGAYIYYTLTTFATEEEGSVDGDDATTDGNDGATDGDDKNNDTTDGNDGTNDGADKASVAYAGRVVSAAAENVGGTNVLYIDPIEITENTIIRAFAVKEGYRNSDVVEFVYYVKDEKKNWGDIIPEDRALFKDGSEVPEGIWVAGVKDTEYTGKAIKFNVRVYDYKTMLTEKKDYTIKYSNNKKVASTTDRKAPTVTINGKGNYKGKQLVKFNILPRDISGDEFEADDMWAAITGKIQKPAPVITWGKTKLKNKKDFTVDPASSIGYSAGGTYTVTVTGVGNYCGTRTLEYTLTDKPLMSKAKVVGVKAVSYTGKAITQPVSVSHSGMPLALGTDYEVEYRNNVEIGTATVVIIGKGNYAGIKKVNFKINPISTINKVSFAFSPVTYTGKAITVDSKENPLKISANYKGIPLTEGVDYVIDSYSNNVAAGKASVVIRGINSYSGTVKKTFKIDAANVATLKLKFINEKGEIITGTPVFGYCKGGTKPSVYLEYEGKALKAGTDYTLSYKKNKAMGVATVTVKGKKNFKGSLAGSFSITSQDISKLRISIPDVPYQNAANIYVSKPVIYDLDGRKLAAGKDYSAKVVYTYAVDCYVMQGKNEVFREGGTPVNEKDILPVGTMIKATVSGAGNYVGQIEGIYRIVKGTIAKAKVTVTPQEYTGKEIQPGKSQIKVVVGDTTLAPTDYEIVGYSKNISTGTATITLRGAGDYGGTVTAKFKIYQQNFIISKILSLFGF